MATVSIFRNKVTGNRCDGSSVNANATTYNVTTSAHPAHDSIVRPSTPAKAKMNKFKFRQFTDYSVSGRTYTNSPGVTESRLTIASCDGKPGSTLQHSVNESQCLITSVSLGTASGVTPLTTDRENSLLTQAYANAREQAFDVYTNLGELPEAIRMLANCKKRLFSALEETVPAYIKHMKKSAKGSTFNPLLISVSDISSFWLEYRYGWRPLIGTIMDLNEAVRKVRIHEHHVLSGTAQKTYDFSRTVSVGQHGYSAWMRQPLSVEVENTVTHRAKAAILVSPYEASFRGNTVSTVWELTTLSFVVDWLIDVSSFIAAATERPPLTSTFATSIDVRTKVKVEGRTDLNPSDEGNGYHVVTPVVCTVEDFSYTRKAHGNTFTPSLPLQFNVDDLKILDLGAILSQLLRKGLTK